MKGKSYMRAQSRGNSVFAKMMTIVALMLTFIVTGAWAQQTYTVTFSADYSQTISDATLPYNKTISCTDLNRWAESFSSVNIEKGDGKVSASIDGGSMTITVSGAFSGEAEVWCPIIDDGGDQILYVVKVTCVANAPAEPTTTQFAVTLKEDTEDATSWQGKAGEGEYQELPLEGVAAGTTVTLKYSGERDVKSVKAPVIPVEGKTNEWTLQMPDNDVIVEVDYYQPATIDGSLAANNGVPSTTDEPLVVAEGTSFTVSGGTLLFAFGENDQTAPDLDSDAWTEDYPTAEDIAEAGTAYVWYYVKGQDGDDPRSNTAPQCITVQIADAPTYNVTFAESTPEPDKWSAQPNEGLKKGDKVTVTYTGQKKVIGVKAEKKAAPKLLNFSPMGQIFYYYEGETWGQAIQNHPENAANGWYIEEFGITIMYKGRALCDSAHDDDITKDTVVNPNGGYLWGPEP